MVLAIPCLPDKSLPTHEGISIYHPCLCIFFFCLFLFSFFVCLYASASILKQPCLFVVYQWHFQDPTKYYQSINVHYTRSIFELRIKLFQTTDHTNVLKYINNTALVKSVNTDKQFFLVTMQLLISYWDHNAAISNCLFLMTIFHTISQAWRSHFKNL